MSDSYKKVKLITERAVIRECAGSVEKNAVPSLLLFIFWSFLLFFLARLMFRI